MAGRLFLFLLSGYVSFKPHLMRRILFSLFVGLVALSAVAQEKFADHLRKAVPGKGTVVLHQDAVIEALLNAGGYHVADKHTSLTDAEITGEEAGGMTEESRAGQSKIKTGGYRIQVYSGGNSRAAREAAVRVGNKVKTYFSDMSVYTQFRSPRWLCRVGDFKTYEEAAEALHALKETKQFNDAIIVKSPIQIYY